MIVLLLSFLLFIFIGEGVFLYGYLPEGLFLFLLALYLVAFVSLRYEYNRCIDILMLEFSS